MKMTSTFAATTWPSARLPATRRVNADRRGRSAWIVAISSSRPPSTATQSPTAGKSSGPRVSKRYRPDTDAERSPSAVRIV